MSYFKTRGVGGDFVSIVTVRDDAPSWVLDSVREAHCGDMPRDWVYETCAKAFDRIEDGSLTEDTVQECAESDTDIYTYDLASWYADMWGTRVVAEAESDFEDMGFDRDVSISDHIAKVQFCAIARIYSVCVAAAIKE